MAAQPEKIGRHLTLLHGVSVVVGCVIGSGIFISPVGVILRVKSAGLSLIIWLATGLFSILGALCFAELGTTITRSGGEYVYIKEAFGPIIGFITLWTEFFLISAIPMATSSQVFALYFVRPIFGGCDPPDAAVKLIGCIAILIIVFINVVNVRLAARVQVIFTVSKLIALLTIIIFGFIHLGQGKVENFSAPFEDSDASLGAICLSFYSGFWAFGGWNNLNFLVDEIINPKRNLPLAIILSMTIVTVVYLLANISYLAVLTPQEVMSSGAVAFTFADAKFPSASWIMPLFVSLSIFGAVNGAFLCNSRIYMVGAEEKQLPGVVAMVSVNYRSPFLSLILLTIITVGLLLFADIFYLIELLGFTFAFVLLLTMAAFIWLRVKRPDLPRPIKIPIVIPVLLFLWAGVLVVMTIYKKPTESLLAVIIILCSIPIYIVFIAWENKPASFVNLITKCMINLQKVLNIADDSRIENKVE